MEEIWKKKFAPNLKHQKLDTKLSKANKTLELQIAHPKFAIMIKNTNETIRESSESIFKFWGVSKFSEFTPQ